MWKVQRLCSLWDFHALISDSLLARFQQFASNNFSYVFTFLDLDKKEQIEKVEEEERLKREKEEKERKEADDAKLEASKVEEKTEVHEEAVKSDIHDKIGLLEDYPPLKVNYFYVYGCYLIDDVKQTL